MNYFEFSQETVDAGHFPSTICCKAGKVTYFMKVMTLAERVYSIKGNTITEYKNRNEQPGTKFISDEDKLILKLKAVPI